MSHNSFQLCGNFNFPTHKELPTPEISEHTNAGLPELARAKVGGGSGSDITPERWSSLPF